MGVRDQALAMRAQGMTGPKIAAALGVSKNTVYRWTDSGYLAHSREASREAKRRRTGTCLDCGTVTHAARDGGVAPRCPTCAPIAARKIEHDLVVELRRQGLSQQQIADRVGCRQASVSNILAANGMSVGKGCGPNRGPRLVAA